MGRDSEVRSRTQQFAETIVDLLNGTVMHSATFYAALIDDRRAAFGTMNPNKLNDITPLRLESVSPFAYVWLDFGFTTYLNDANHLTVEASFVTILTGANAEHELFRYDYEREKENDYPEAHLQLGLDSQPLDDLLAAVGRPKHTVKHLHFPVGGRRYRPPMEDVIEFLIREGLVASRPGAAAVINKHRDAFRRIQLMAAVKAHPDIAAEALDLEGYDVRKRGRFAEMGRKARRGRKG